MAKKTAIAGLILLGAAWSSVASDNLPATAAETLSGEKLEFPSALAGKASVCVFGFSQESGDAVKVWMNQLSKDGINAWSIAELESSPRLMRGVIRKGMRKSTPPQLLDHSLVLTKDAKAWKRVLGTKQEKLPVVILLDAAGHIAWNYVGLPRHGPYGELKAKLAALQAEDIKNSRSEFR
jgi:hypothetical protein